MGKKGEPQRKAGALQTTVEDQVAVERERALRALYEATDAALKAATPAEASKLFIATLKRNMAI